MFGCLVIGGVWVVYCLVVWMDLLVICYWLDFVVCLGVGVVLLVVFVMNFICFSVITNVVGGLDVGVVVGLWFVDLV